MAASSSSSSSPDTTTTTTDSNDSNDSHNVFGSTLSLPSRIRRRRRADGTTYRQGHLLSLMGTEWDGYVYLSDVYISGAQYLAVKHLREKSGAVLPQLPTLLEGCDFEMTFRQIETRYSPVDAVQGLLDATEDPKDAEENPWNEHNNHLLDPNGNGNSNAEDATTFTIIHEGEIVGQSHINHTHTAARQRQLQQDTAELGTAEEEEDEDDSNDWQHPFAVVGAAYSYVTIPVNIVAASALELPMLSGSATSSALDGQPLFGRSIPTNRGDSHAAMRYYQHRGITHVACLYIQDPFGTAYHADLQKEARHFNITLESFPYLETEDDIQSTLEQLKASQLRHVFAVLLDWKPIMGPAYDLGVVGHPDYSWIAAEMVEWTADDFVLNRTTTTLEEGFHEEDFYDSSDEEMPLELKWAHALNGIGQITLHVEDHPRFAEAMAEFADDNSTLRHEYTATYSEPELWKDLLWTTPDYNIWQTMNYDATIAFGIAACQTPGLFTGPELFETLMNIEFEGVTGNVSFDPTTGTRSADSVKYRIDNLVLHLEESDDEYIRFDSRLAVLVGNGQVEEVNDFRYYGNTTVMPSVLPPVQDYNYNLIPAGAQAFGWFLGAALMAMSLGWMVWVHRNDKTVIVQASQPIFLFQLCLGTLLMAAAIIPMGFQGTEPTAGLHAACMFIPWLAFVGFVTALAALFSKAWRLNQLLNSGLLMRRVQVQVVDVIWPFVLLMSINITLLTAWTIVAPLEYVREENSYNVDMFGRSVESFGTCKTNPDNTSVSSVWFQVPIVLVNFVTLGIATYQSYKARHLPTEFSESTHLAISMASLLESLLLGGPILFVTLDNPTAFFVVGSALLSIACMCILLPVFLPKYQKRKAVVLTTTLRQSVATASFRRKGSSFRDSSDGGFQTPSSNNGFSREFQPPRPAAAGGYSRNSPVSADSWNVTTSLVSEDGQSYDSGAFSVSSATSSGSKKKKKKEAWGRMSIRRTNSDRSLRGSNLTGGSSHLSRSPPGSRGRASTVQSRASTMQSRSICSIPEDVEEYVEEPIE